MTDSVEVKDLAHFRKYNQNKLVIALSNINSLRNKFKLRIKQKNVGILLKQKLTKTSATVNSKFMVLTTLSSRPQRERRRNYAVI